MLEMMVRSQVRTISQRTFLTVLVGREVTGWTTARYLTLTTCPYYLQLRTIELNPPVSSHEYEGVDGDIGRDVDDVLDRPAPGQTEGPEHEDVVTGRGRDTDQDEQEVRHGQVEDQQVGRVLHLGVPVDLGPGHSYRITLRATRETDRQREKYEMI